MHCNVSEAEDTKMFVLSFRWHLFCVVGWSSNALDTVSLRSGLLLTSVNKAVAKPSDLSTTKMPTHTNLRDMGNLSKHMSSFQDSSPLSPPPFHEETPVVLRILVSSIDSGHKCIRILNMLHRSFDYPTLAFAYSRSPCPPRS